MQQTIQNEHAKIILILAYKIVFLKALVQISHATRQYLFSLEEPLTHKRKWINIQITVI